MILRKLDLARIRKTKLRKIYNGKELIGNDWSCWYLIGKERIGKDWIGKDWIGKD